MRKRYLYFSYALLVYLCLGLIYAWSVFVSPLEAEFGWSRSQTSLTFTVSLFGYCFGSISGGVLVRKLRTVRVSFLLGAALFLTGFLCASGASSPIGFYVSYGMCCGLGVGFCYNGLMSGVSKWFPDRHATIAGLLLVGFGCGGMLLGTLASVLMERIGYRTTFKVFAALFSLVALGASFIIRIPNAAESLLLPSPPPSKAAGIDTPTLEMLKSRSYRHYQLWNILLSAGGLMLLGAGTQIAEEVGAPHALAVTAAGMLSLGNGSGRALIGWIYDRTDYRQAMIWNSALYMVSLPLMLLSFTMRAPWLLFPAFLAMGAAYGGIGPLNAAIARTFYGEEYYMTNLPMITVGLLPSSLLGPVVASGLHERFNSYSSLTWAALLLGIAGTVFLFKLKKPEDTEAKMQN